jgi:ADP-ribosyl-[dinitrogen reductase] hydrolase
MNLDNANLLHDLLEKKIIRLHDSQFLHMSPDPLPIDFDYGKVEGMLLGTAVGDSLGATSEGKSPGERNQLYGEIRDYIPGSRSDNRAIGIPTDDTQLTFWTLKQLISDGGLIPDNLAKSFCKHHIVGIGNTVKSFLRNYKDENKPWYYSGLDSLGNGALMRISSIVVPYLKNPNQSMYADAAIDTMLTHNSYANISCCISFVAILWSLLGMKSVPEPVWWVEKYCETARDLEGNTEYYPQRSKYSAYKGSLFNYTEQVVKDALRRRLSTMEACEEWGSGANLFETVPSVLYILAQYAHNGEEAIIRAVNDTKDNDTIAAIIGAAVGALHGINGIPDRWIKGLTGRTSSSDDGQVFKLIVMAKKHFWYQQ